MPLVYVLHSALCFSRAYHFVGGLVADNLENLEIEGFCCIFVVGILEIVIKPYI